MTIQAQAMYFKDLNQMIRTSDAHIVKVEQCLGQRYIGCGTGGKQITIYGTPGNALGAYLDGSEILVFGNAQDATGDTMNDGAIYVYGSAGDATGYAMRGGKIFVQGDAGYRCGIHMKAYQDKSPLLLIGGSAGSFLGEYQAGGTIIVLGLHADAEVPVGNFCATGMHGGKIYLRCDALPSDLPANILVEPVEESDLLNIRPYLDEFCARFEESLDEILDKPFFRLTPDTQNPYKQLYTPN